MNKKKLLVIVLLVLLLVPIYFMEIDHFIFGDEVITYNMANNKEAGFVFSEGRISDYLRTEVFSGKDGIIKSIASMGKDLIKHKANAQILNYPRDKEVRLYEAEEVKGWFYKAEEDRFDFLNTWIHSLSDDANPWGYYELVNLSSSIFPEISGTKWSAFLVNILFYLGNLLILLVIGKKIGNTYYQNIAMLIFVGVASTILTNSVTTLRPYAVASFWATSFAYASICMLERVMANEAIASKHLIGIVALYVFGYITHYTMGIVLLSFGITLLFYTNVFFKKNLWIIFSTGMAAFILGLFFSPESLIGLLRKLLKRGTEISDIKNSSRLLGSIIIILIIVLIILFVGNILKKRQITQSNLDYLVLSSLFVALIARIATGSFGYARIMFPIFCAITFRVIYLIYYRFISSYNKVLAQMVMAVFLVCFCATNLVSAYKVTIRENQTFEQKQEALSRSSLSPICLYFRKHAKGYGDTLCLVDRFEYVQVITIDTENWEQYIEFDGTAPNVVCFFSEDSEDEGVKEWVRNLGYNVNTDIYIDEETHIYYSSKE